MLYKKLKELREFKGLTQGEVAAELKITREAYSKYETNRRQMNYESLCMLADFFGVTTDYLLGRGEQTLFLLNDTEKEMINKYRALDGRGRQNVAGLLNMEYSRSESKKGSEKRVI